MKLPRFNATAPRAVQRTTLPTGMTRADDIGALSRVPDNSSMWKAVGQAGEAMRDVGQSLFAIDQHKRQLDRELKTSQFMQGLSERDDAQKETLVTANITTEEEQRKSLETIKKSRDDWISEWKKTNKATDPELLNDIQRHSNLSEPEFLTHSKSITTARWNGYQIAARMEEATKLNANGEFGRADSIVEKLGVDGLVEPLKVLELKKDNIVQQVSYFINSGNFDEARKTVDVKKDQLNPDETASLNNTIRISEKSKKQDLTKQYHALVNSSFVEMDKGDKDDISLLERKTLADSIKSKITLFGEQAGIDTKEDRNYISAWEKNESLKPNYEVVDKIADMMDDFANGGETTAEQIDTEIKQSAGNNFDTTKAGELRNKLSELKKVDGPLRTNSDYIKNAKSLLRSSIVVDLGLFYGEDNSQKIEYEKTIMKLEEDVKSGTLTGNAIWDEAVKISEKYEGNFVQRRMDATSSQIKAIKEAKKQKGTTETPFDKMKKLVPSRYGND